MNRTKAIIIDAFWQLLEERPYNKITVKDMVDRCQINRNTFYYHFHDIPELLEITVKKDADDIILTCSRFGSPLDCITPIVERLSQKKKAILHIYRSVQRDIFLEQLERISLYSVTQYVDTVASGLTLSQDDRALLINFYKCLLVGILLDWLGSGMNYDLLKRITRITELHCDSGRQAFLRAAESAESHQRGEHPQ